MKKYHILIISALIWSACSEHKTEDHDHDEHSELLTLSKEQMAYNHIEEGSMATGKVNYQIKATGRVDVPPNFSVNLSSPVEGYVTNLKVLPGDKVGKGQIVAKLRHPKIADIQRDYLSIKSQYEYLSKDVERKKDLLDGNTVSIREYEKLLSEQQAKGAALQSLKAELQRLGISTNSITAESISQYLDVRAPISGVITETYVQTGAYVDSDASLINILNKEHVHVEMEVFQNDLSKLKKGMPVNMRIPGQEKTYLGEVFLINTQLDPETLSANVHVHPEGEFPELAINSVVFGEIIYRQDSGHIVPNNEIIRKGNQHFVFAKKDEGYERVTVQTGHSDDKNTLITGPAEVFDQTVITKGSYYLNGDIESETGHSH